MTLRFGRQRLGRRDVFFAVIDARDRAREDGREPARRRHGCGVGVGDGAGEGDGDGDASGESVRAGKGDGSEVGVATGSGDFQLWPAFVKATGIDDAKVQKVFMGPEALIKMLIEEQVDAEGNFTGFDIDFCKALAAAGGPAPADPGDGRRVLLKSTAKSLALLERLAPYQRRINDVLFEFLDAKRFRELREWLADDVEFEAEEGAPIFDGYLVMVAGGSFIGAAPLNQCTPVPPLGDPRRSLANAGVPLDAGLLRELAHMGQTIQSHSMHFFELAGPDLLLGFDADPAIRNVVGLVQQDPQTALKAIELRKFGQMLIAAVGDRRVHPNFAVPGGVNRPLPVEQRDAMLRQIPQMIDHVHAGLALMENWLHAQAELVEEFFQLNQCFSDSLL